MTTPETSSQRFEFGCMRNAIPDVGDTLVMLDRDLLLRKMGSYAHGEVVEYDMTIGCMACSEDCVVSKRVADNVVTDVRFPNLPREPFFSDKGKKHCIEF
jgi:hypothetical protein